MLCAHENKRVIFQLQVETYFELSSFDVTLSLQDVFPTADDAYGFVKQNITHSMIWSNNVCFLGSVAQNRLNAHTKNTLKTNSDSLKKRKSVIDIIIP